MKALVTGATGIIGANLVRELLAEGHQVTALVRRSSDRSALDGLDARCHEGNVLDTASLRSAVDGVEIVFHAAAIFAYSGHTQVSLDQVAVNGTRHVLEAAADAGVKRVVFTSSSVVFGSSAHPEVRDESSSFADPRPTKYALSKNRQQRAAFELASTVDVEVLAVCPTVTVGAHDYRLSTSNAVIGAYLNDPWRSTFLGGCNIVSARDVARGHLLVAERGAANESYLLGSQNMTWHDLHHTISQLCSLRGPWITLNHTASYLLAAAAEWQAHLTNRRAPSTLEQARMVGRYYWYSHAKTQDIGYTPAPADQAIAGALQWLLKTQHINRFVRDSIVLQHGSLSSNETTIARVS